MLLSLPTRVYRVAGLPPAARHALYNLGDDSHVPAHQLAFYCFNYGDSAAMSFAAGLPWRMPAGSDVEPRDPIQVMPRPVGAAVFDLPYWFVIGGQVEITGRASDTVHLRFDGIDVSIFVLEMLSPFVDHRRLSVTGLLATKLHAILDRGTRRDFFDLYVALHRHALGIVECLASIRRVYRQEISDTLLLRALTFFDDADREAPLIGEGPDDWATVKDFFWTRVGQLLIPPSRELAIERREVDVAAGA